MQSSRREALAGLSTLLVGAGIANVARAAGATEAVVPFELTYNQAWTAVKVEDHGWYKFLIDTGARTFCLDDKIAQSIGLQRRSSNEVMGAVGSTHLNSYIARDINITNVVHDANVAILGLKYGTGDAMQGLIPAGLLGSVRFDFVQKRLHLSQGSLDKPEGFQALTWLGSHDDRLASPYPKIQAMLDGRPLTLTIDTGSQSGLYLFGDYVSRAGIWDKYGKGDDVVMMGVAGAGRSRYVRAKSFELGGIAFDAPRVALESPEEKMGVDRGADGLLGLEMLRRLDLAIEPAGSRVFLRPNVQFNDVERRNRAGLEVRMVGGKATAVAVAEGGPAWKAGVRRGDLVVGYAGGDASVAGLNWKLEGPAGDPIAMVISHEGQQKQISFPLEDPK
jgi:predicted aspartyl protease